MIKGKKGSALIIVIILAILIIWLSSTNKIVVNDQQVITATDLTCQAIHKDYDPINKVCIEPTQDVQENPET